MNDTPVDENRLKPLLGPDLTPQCTPLGVVLALVSISDFSSLKFYLNAILENQLNPSDIYEILLQSHLFSGFPRAITGLQIFHQVLMDRGMNPEEHFNEAPQPSEEMGAIGLKLFNKVYRKKSEAVLNSLHSMHPGYDRWVLEDAYGRVLSRPFLSGKTRELCAVAALTATGCLRQLMSHINGALNLGATNEEIICVIQNMSSIVEEKKIQDALEICDKLKVK